MRRVRLRRAVEGGLYEHAQPYIRAALMMGVFSCICSGVLWGRVGLQCRILGGVIVSFLGGEGEGKRNSRARNAETMRRCFAGRCEFRTAPVIYYMLGSGGFTAPCFRPSRKVPSTSMPWAAHVRCSGFDNPSTSLRIDICEGAVAPRSASTELCVCCLCTCVLCCYVLYVYYMYMSVICS